jgi:hypothetical protein
MMTRLEVSKSFSLNGFDLKKLVAGNKEAVKIIVGAVVSIAMLYPESAFVVTMLGGATIVVKHVLDAINFYISDVKLE